MELKKISHKLTVCKVADISEINTTSDFYFIGKTDEELSLVCKTEDTPMKTIERDDGWKCFRIQGVLDFSLIGILSKISGILAKNEIGIFAVSTYNTDYILVKEENFEKALKVLEEEGYAVVWFKAIVGDKMWYDIWLFYWKKFEYLGEERDLTYYVLER